MSVAAASPAVADHEDGLPNPQRLIAFLVIALGIIMAVLDGTIVNVALPAIALDQHATAAQSVWIVTGYQLAVVVGLLPMAALAESIGFRKVFGAGILIFAAASLLCAFSNSLLVLTVARIIQGLGGAALMSIASALVRFIMPVKYLGRGIAAIALVVAVSGAAGPSIAAAILYVATWHWLFLINVPLGIICLLAGRAVLPETPASGHPFDFRSAALNALTLGPLISGLSTIGSGGELPWWIPAGQIAVAAVAGYFLVRRQEALKVPMLPVDLLNIKAFRLSIIASILSFSAQMLGTVSLPFFFARSLSFDPVRIGLLMTPWPVATAILAPIAARFAERYSAARVSGIGSTIFAIGLLATAFMPAHPTDFDIVWRLFITGAGFGLFQSPNNRVMLGSAPRRRSGGASGMQSTARLLGQSIGAAIAAMVFGFAANDNLPLTMSLAAAFALAAAVLSIWR